MIILNGESSEHLDMLEGGVIQRLLEEKWKTFARVLSPCPVCFCVKILETLSKFTH